MSPSRFFFYFLIFLKKYLYHVSHLSVTRVNGDICQYNIVTCIKLLYEY